MADNNYKRPKFYKKKHGVRHVFMIIAALIIISLGIFIYLGYSSSQKTTEPIEESAFNHKTVNETIHSDSSHATAQKHNQSANSSATSNGDHASSESRRAMDANARHSADKNGSDVQESARLKGKKISDAISWAKAHHRYYSWSITSGGSDAVVTSVTDDGHTIVFIASAK